MERNVGRSVSYFKDTTRFAQFARQCRIAATRETDYAAGALME